MLINSLKVLWNFDYINIERVVGITFAVPNPGLDFLDIFYVVILRVDSQLKFEDFHKYLSGNVCLKFQSRNKSFTNSCVSLVCNAIDHTENCTTRTSFELNFV